MKGILGTCDCRKNDVWKEAEWEDPWCNEGKCYTSQTYSNCVGKPNGMPLYDGSWCYDGRRYIECPTKSGNKNN